MKDPKTEVPSCVFLKLLTQEVLRKWRVWIYVSVQFSSVQSLSRVWLSATPWIAACQASLSITNSRSSLRLTSIESVMPSSRLILCRPLLLLPSIFPSIRVFSNESVLYIRCLQHHSSKASILWRSVFFTNLTLTSIHDYWKNRSLD